MTTLVSRFRVPALAALVPLMLAGCSANFNGTMSGGLAQRGVALHGVLMGGRQPLTSAKLFLYKAPSGATDSYGTASTSVLVAPGTVVASGNTSQGNTYTDDGGTTYYTLSDATTGSFNLTDDYSCAPNDQMFLVSKGGNAGLTGPPPPNNAAAQLMVALGSCSSLSATTNITMNELTTIVAVTALQQFMTDSTHIAAPQANQQGLNNAFTTANLLVNYANGVPNSATATMSFRDDKVYTIGNAMAACVNSPGYTQGDGAACDQFFLAASTNSATNTPFATEPSNTVDAMLLIAHNPGVTAGGVVAINPTFPVYGPQLTQVNDLALPITYLGNGLGAATTIAVDADGNAFIADCRKGCDNNDPASATDNIVSITPAGYVAPNGFGNGTVHLPQGIAIDTNNKIWDTDGSPSVSVFNRNGTLYNNITNPTPAGPLHNPEGIAIDPNNLGYVANSAGANVLSVDANGNFGTPLSVAGLNVPVGVAIDPTGRIVVTDNGSGSSLDGGIAVFTPDGAGGFLSAVSHATGFHPTSVALDNSHNIWVIDPNVGTLYQYDYTGATLQITDAVPHTGSVQGLAIDGSNQVLLPSCNSVTCGLGATDSDALFVLDNSGNPTTANGVGNDSQNHPYYGVRDPNLSNPVAVAVDGSGNAWVSSANTGAVTVFVGLVSPVVTPLSVAVQNNKVGVKP